MKLATLLGQSVVAVYGFSRMVIMAMWGLGSSCDGL